MSEDCLWVGCVGWGVGGDECGGGSGDGECGIGVVSVGGVVGVMSVEVEVAVVSVGVGAEMGMRWGSGEGGPTVLD